MVESYHQLRHCEGSKHVSDLGLRLQTDCAAGQVVAAFVVAAVAPPCLSEEEHEQLLALLRARDIGTERGLSSMQRNDKWWVIYDKARSPGWLLNAPLLVGGRCSGAKKPQANVVRYVPRGEEGVVFVVTKKPLKAGSDLWFAYGSSNGMLREVRAARKERSEKRPRVNRGPVQRKEARRQQTDAARKARWTGSWERPNFRVVG